MHHELDKIDRRILYELDQNCRIPETRLAKIVGKSKEAIRYRIKNLCETGIICGYSTHINLGRLGYRAYKVYLKLREKPALKHRFLEHIRSRKDVFWLGVGDGAWSVGITFMARSDDEFYAKKNELYNQYRELVLGEVNGSMVEAVAFGKKFLINTPEREVETAFVFAEAEEVQIDDVERRILGVLMRNSRTKIVDLASQCNTSVEVARNRIKRMEENGVIQRYWVDIDYAKLGAEFYKTFLYFEGLSPKMQKRIYERARHHPNVLFYIRVIAPWVLELEIMVENYEKYNEVINQFRHDFADVLINVESTTIGEDVHYPAKTTIFE